MIYQLPSFPQFLQEALEKRDPVCREDSFRKKIIRVLFDDIIQYGM